MKYFAIVKTAYPNGEFFPVAISHQTEREANADRLWMSKGPSGDCWEVWPLSKVKENLGKARLGCFSEKERLEKIKFIKENG